VIRSAFGRAYGVTSELLNRYIGIRQRLCESAFAEGYSESFRERAAWQADVRCWNFFLAEFSQRDGYHF